MEIKDKTTNVTEKKIQRDIISFLRKHSFSVDILTISSYGRKGMADIVGCAPDGRFIAIEVKRPGGKLTVMQENWLAEKQHHGGVVFVAYNVDDVKSVLTSSGYSLEDNTNTNWVITKEAPEGAPFSPAFSIAK